MSFTLLTCALQSTRSSPPSASMSGTSKAPWWRPQERIVIAGHGGDVTTITIIFLFQRDNGRHRGQGQGEGGVLLGLVDFNLQVCKPLGGFRRRERRVQLQPNSFQDFRIQAKIGESFQNTTRCSTLVISNSIVLARTLRRGLSDTDVSPSALHIG